MQLNIKRLNVSELGRGDHVARWKGRNSRGRGQRQGRGTKRSNRDGCTFRAAVISLQPKERKLSTHGVSHRRRSRLAIEASCSQTASDAGDRDHPHFPALGAQLRAALTQRSSSGCLRPSGSLRLCIGSSSRNVSHFGPPLGPLSCSPGLGHGAGGLRGQHGWGALGLLDFAPS